MGQLIVAGRRRVGLGIGAVDAIDLGALEHHVAAHLGGAQDGTGVGREERVAGAAGEQHHTARLEVGERHALGEGFADGGHGKRRHHPGRHATGRERGIERQRVHHGGQHAHVIGADPVDAGRRDLGAPDKVAAADHDADLTAQRHHLADLVGDTAHRRRRDAEAFRTCQRLAGQFQEDAAPAEVGGHGGVLSCWARTATTDRRAETRIGRTL